MLDLILIENAVGILAEVGGALAAFGTAYVMYLRIRREKDEQKGKDDNANSN